MPLIFSNSLGTCGFAKRYPIYFQRPIGVTTTSTGEPVDIRDTNTLNTNLLLNRQFVDTTFHTGERIPERLVHAKGTGASGYFEVTHDVSNICNADVINGIGKKTPVSVRFSPSSQNAGGADLSIEPRGCGMKFYTKEGNLDLLSLNTPVYLYRDPGMFTNFVHATKRNPATNLFDLSSQWDLITKRPESIHDFLWLLSDFGMPNRYRHMSCSPIHTFEVVNKIGESHFIRFNFTTDQGIENLSLQEAIRIRSLEPDYYVRDLYNEIAKKNYPSWTLYIDVMTKHDLETADFDPFDVTRTWPRGRYPSYQVGRVVLNQNPKNMFAEIEQMALHPSNLVPGIVGPPDKLFQGRVISYKDAHNHRLGFNHNNILVNLPLHAKTYNRDGQPPVNNNMKDVPNYYPNSFNGPLPTVDITKPDKSLVILESSAVDLQPAFEFYTQVLNAAQRERLVSNTVFQISRTVPLVQKNAIKLLTNVHPDLGRRVATGLQNANSTIVTPNEIL